MDCSKGSAAYIRSTRNNLLTASTCDVSAMSTSNDSFSSLSTLTNSCSSVTECGAEECGSKGGDNESCHNKVYRSTLDVQLRAKYSQLSKDSLNNLTHSDTDSSTVSSDRHNNTAPYDTDVTNSRHSVSHKSPRRSRLSRDSESIKSANENRLVRTNRTLRKMKSLDAGYSSHSGEFW